MIKTLPLEKAIYVIKTDRKLGMILLHSKIKQSRTINQKSETKIFNFKIMQVQVQESSIMQVSGKYVFDNSKRSFCQQQYSTASTNKDCNSKQKKSII